MADAPNNMLPDPDEGAARRSYPLTRTVGTLGLKKSGGYIEEEFLKHLKGKKGLETLNEMSTNSPTLGAVVFAIKSMLRAVQWRVEPADNSDGAKEGQKLVEGMLTDMPYQSWADVIDAAASMVVYGYSLQEILWRKRDGYNGTEPWKSSDFNDGLITPYMLAPRSQLSVEQWIYDRSGDNLLAFTQEDPETGQRCVVPINRCLHYRTTTERANPMGKSLIRNAYTAWYFANRLEQIEGVGVERDMAGYPVMRVPGEIMERATPEMAQIYADYTDMIKNVRRDAQEGIILPSDRDEKGHLYYEFELLSARGSRNVDISASIQRYNVDMARAVLADVIFLGTGSGTGSYALSDSKLDLFLTALSSFNGHMQAQFNEHLLPMIWRINGMPRETRPKLVPGVIRQRDLTSLGAFVKSLSEAGILSADVNTEQQLRMVAGLPTVADDARARETIQPELKHAYHEPAAPAGGEGAFGKRKTMREQMIEKGLING